MEALGLSAATAQLWLLFAMRTAGFVFITPLFSGRNVPMQFKLVLGFFLTALAFTAWSPSVGQVARAAALAGGMADFFPLAISELVLGLMLGFIVGLVFVTVQFAGQLVGYQMGFAIVNVLDPQSQNQVSLISEFLFAAVMLAFLSLNLHHDMLGLWYESYHVAPIGAWNFEAIAQHGNPFIPALVQTFDDLVLLSLKMALPLLAFLLLTDLALGIIARVMPQMNVFIVGIPLKIAMGLFFLSLVVLQLDPLTRQTTLRFINHAGELLQALAGAAKPV